MWWLCRISSGKIHQAFSLCFAYYKRLRTGGREGLERNVSLLPHGLGMWLCGHKIQHAPSQVCCTLPTTTICQMLLLINAVSSRCWDKVYLASHRACLCSSRGGWNISNHLQYSTFDTSCVCNCYIPTSSNGEQIWNPSNTCLQIPS